jgi:hypothetical protein
MPDLASSELYPGPPHLLVDSDVRHSPGWQVDRKDPAAAEVIVASLAQRDRRGRAVADRAALAAETLCHMRNMTFKGGSAEGPMTKDHPYDLRFMSDRATVCATGSADVIVELQYRDVESVDVSGSVPSAPVPRTIALTLIRDCLAPCWDCRSMLAQRERSI